MSSRTRSRNAFENTLDGTLTSGGNSVDLVSASGLVAPLYAVLAPSDPDKREFVKVGAINTNTLSSITRNLDGSAAGAPFEHGPGTKFRMVPVHQHLDDIFDDIEAIESDIDDLESFESTHSADADAHGLTTHAADTDAHGLDTHKADVDAHHDQLHAADHADGGADEVSVSGLAGYDALPRGILGRTYYNAGAAFPTAFTVIPNFGFTVTTSPDRLYKLSLDVYALCVPSGSAFSSEWEVRALEDDSTALGAVITDFAVSHGQASYSTSVNRAVRNSVFATFRGTDAEVEFAADFIRRNHVTGTASLAQCRMILEDIGPLLT